MMDSSSKYAKLPFIALGEKDIFETDDLPEADQLSVNQKQLLYDSSIEIVPFNSAETFKKFAQAEVQSLQSEDRNVEESFTDRLKRIQAEIDDLKNVAASSSQSSKTEPNTEYFEQELQSLSNKLGSLYDICFTKIDSAQIVNDVKKSAEILDRNQDSLIQYELYRKPDKDEMKELSKINLLEQRIKKIETTLGIDDTALQASYPIIGGGTLLKDRSIRNIIIQLSNKVVQLDNSSLDRVDARLNYIIEKLNQISNKKSALTELDKENKLNEIHEFYVKINRNQALIPGLLERLQVLNEIQNKASKFSQTLLTMEQTQNEIKSTMDTNQHQIKVLREHFQQNSSNIKELLDDFRSRLEKIKKS